MNVFSKSAMAVVLAGILELTANSHQAAAASSKSIHIVFSEGQHEVSLNGVRDRLAQPPLLLEGQPYVPVRWLVAKLGLSLTWNEQTEQVHMLTPKAFIQFDINQHEVVVNGVPDKFDTAAAMAGDTLLVNLSWLARYVTLQVQTDAQTQKIQVLYVQAPPTAFPRSDFLTDDLPNSRPVAKFMFGKSTYRIGEPVQVIDLSYDPDSEGLPGYEWTGKQEAYFQPGTYEVSLKVTDPQGNKSDSYTQTVHVENSVYVEEWEYPLYFKPSGTIVKPAASFTASIANSPPLQKTVRHLEYRKLLSVDSYSSLKPIANRQEQALQNGFLYSERVDGLARLYVNHRNIAGDNQQYAIAVHNISDTKAITVTTSHKGIAIPSLFANIAAGRAAVDYMVDGAAVDTVEVPPLETVFFASFDNIKPGEGFTAMYDVHTDGQAEFSFVTASPGAKPSDLNGYKVLAPSDLVQRGTSAVSEVQWAVDASNFQNAAILSIGADETDRLFPAIGSGNQGIVYKIRLNNPRKAAILMNARGGFFTGPVKINGEFAPLPTLAGLTSLDGYLLVARTEGNEFALELEFMAAEGSDFPVDLVLYPLDKKGFSK
jgi:PKD repeat protein